MEHSGILVAVSVVVDRADRGCDVSVLRKSDSVGESDRGKKLAKDMSYITQETVSGQQKQDGCSLSAY